MKLAKNTPTMETRGLWGSYEETWLYFFDVHWIVLDTS